MKNKYYVYCHKKENGDIFYIGVSKYYNRGNKYYRAFCAERGNRNKYWVEIFNQNNKKCNVEIIKEFDNINDAYKLEIELIKKYGKIHNGTGILSNMQDGGFVSEYGKSVLCYNFDGIFLSKYDSVNDAAKKLGIKSSDQIYHSILYGVGIMKKYRFTYYENNYKLKINEYISVTPCFQYELNGKFIKKWRSIEDAATELNINRGGIRLSIKGKYKKYCGFIWSDKIIEFNEKIYEIGKFDMVTKKLLSTYKNASVAQKDTGIYNSSILLCCKGKMKSCGGFIWNYIEKIY